MHILIIGGTGGLGQALVRLFCDTQDVDQVTATYHRQPPELVHPKLNWVALDVTCKASIAALFVACPPLNYIVNTVGRLHTPNNTPEKTITKLDPDFFLDNIRTNTLPTLLIAKYARPALKAAQPCGFAVLSARVGSITDNRLGGWYSYRCSKAALNMAIKTLSIEWQRTLPNCAVVALHPGTVVSQLSAPFTGNTPPARQFRPEQSARWLADIILALKPQDTGKFIAFDGSQIDW